LLLMRDMTSVNGRMEGLSFSMPFCYYLRSDMRLLNGTLLLAFTSETFHSGRKNSFQECTGIVTYSMDSSQCLRFIKKQSEIIMENRTTTSSRLWKLVVGIHAACLYNPLIRRPLGRSMRQYWLSQRPWIRFTKVSYHSGVVRFGDHLSAGCSTVKYLCHSLLHLRRLFPLHPFHQHPPMKLTPHRHLHTEKAPLACVPMGT